MNLEELMLQSEAIIFAADRPVNEEEIAQAILNSSEDISEDNLEKLPSALEAIVDKYENEFYPFEVKKSGGGYQFLSKAVFHPMIAKLNGTKFRKRLSAAAMETLAIIAYRQPSTKSEIEYIRGVNSDYSVQKLLDLELVTILGRKEDAVGKPLLYGTSMTFMDYLGINSIDDLPKLNEIQQYEDIIPTDANEALPSAGEAKMVVNENGEINEVTVDSDQDQQNEVIDTEIVLGNSDNEESEDTQVVDTDNNTSEDTDISENENPPNKEEDNEEEV